MLQRLKRWIIVAAAAWAGIAGAEEMPRPVLGVGATRDEVLEAYGWPSGQSQSGDREIFTYSQGQVVLRNGIVERMDFSAKMDWPKPRPRPAPATTSTAPIEPPGVVEPAPLVPDTWLTDFERACVEARRWPADILALFTAPDWSPPCQRFKAEVALHPEFLAAVQDRFVLLRLEYPTRTPQPAELRQQNAELRERFGVTTYPTLLILNADGSERARVNLAKARPEPSYREQVLAAIEEAKPRPEAISAWKNGSEAPASEHDAGGWKIFAIDRRWWVGGALAAAVILLLWAWRRRDRAEPERTLPEPSRLMPTPTDIAIWDQARVRDVAMRLFAHEGWRVRLRPTGSGAELALFADEAAARPKVLVKCQAAAAGLANASAVRTLLGTVLAEGVPEAWFVSPGGFTLEARQFAAEQKVVLISGEDLLQRLRAVPTLELVRIMAPSA